MKIIYNGIVITQEDVDRWWSTVSEEDKQRIQNGGKGGKGEK